MKITAVSVQARDKNRVNVSVDGKYRLSLEISQLLDLGIKVGREYSEEEFAELEQESQFGKLYARALEYALVRPRSVKEITDYLRRKTLPIRSRDRRSGEWREKPGVAQAIVDRVLARLIEKGHVNDETFAHFWVENRNLRKGASRRTLQAELRAKGVDSVTIEQALAESGRDDQSELQKLLAKKAGRYDDERKLIAYLAGKGFTYDDIKAALVDSQAD